MERQFSINWSNFLEEAKHRRKKLKITQKRLALLAGVSTATLSRFEQGKKDIQLSSIERIFYQLGLLDSRTLTFPDTKYYEDFDRNCLIFFAHEGHKEIRCAISHQALDDYFDATEKTRLKIFQKNRSAIEQKARRKYFAGRLEKDGGLLIILEDFL